MKKKIKEEQIMGNNNGSVKFFAVFVGILVGAVILTAIAFATASRRVTFFQDEYLANKSVYCSEKDQLAIEAYCRLLRYGASPASVRENADIVVFIDKEILYLADKKGKNFLNLPIGPKYIENTNEVFLDYFKNAVLEIAKTK